MARLSLSLLGAMEVTLDRQPVSGFVYNKARALLVFLAVEADRPHHRDALVSLLWPELPDTAARTNLRQALANLREAIGDASAMPPFLIITRDTLQFNPASDYGLDVAEFMALLTACKGHAHRHRERCHSCAARRQQAISLYRGDFMEGVGLADSVRFEEWQLRHRERFHQEVFDAFACLAEYYEWRGDDALACRFTQRQIELDPWREEVHRHLMRLLVRGNRRSAALAQYETCRRVLVRDLGVEPDTETTALYERIRDGASSDLGTPNVALSAAYSVAHHADRRTHDLENFPAQSTVLIGRERELEELGALLGNPACRLITLVGPGGIGKTRLALAAAEAQAGVFDDGTVFVPLAGISTTQFVAPAILSALDVALQGQRDPRDQLVEHLRGKELLLVLDNVEQLIAPGDHDSDGIAKLLCELQERIAGLTLLVTSRVRLGLVGEWLFDVEGLSYPAGKAANGVESYSAVRLFVQRAAQVRRQFALGSDEAHAVVRICQMVEGLPLAIELAAGALRTRSCKAVAAAIEGHLSALSTEQRTVAERHRSMWATFEHSWRLLSEEERLVLARLSVFRGGFEEAAAAEVARASPQILMTLIDTSMVRWDGAARYDMHELVRQFAGEKLEQSGNSEKIRQHHAAYVLALAERAEPNVLSGARERWLGQLELEHDNLRAALAWCQTTTEAGEIGLRLAGALAWFWMYRNYVSEGRAWAEGVLAAAGGSGQPRSCATALYSAGLLAWVQSDFVVAGTRLRESVRRYRETGDRRGLAFALSIVGMVACDQQEYSAGHDLCAESVAILRELNEPWGLALALYFYGNAAVKRGEYTAARPIYEESLALWGTLDDHWGRASALYRLGQVACKRGDYAKARLLHEEGLAIRRQIGQKIVLANSLNGLAEVALCERQYDQATTYLAESLVLFQELDRTAGVADTLEAFAWAEADQTHQERAVRLWGAAQAQRDIAGTPRQFDAQQATTARIAAARAELEATTFAAAWAEGQAMTLEQAIAYALEETEGSLH